VKISFSLKQTWTILIMFAVIAPVAIVMAWYGQQLYDNRLNSALTIERQGNELLRNKIEAEIKRLKTLLQNKSDPLSLLIDGADNPDTLKDINKLLRFIVEREQAIREVMILSRQADVIAAIDPDVGITGDKLLSAEELRSVALHWGFDKKVEYPEVVIPLMGRDYIGSPKKHEDFIAIDIAIPIGHPAKAVLIALINVDNLWPANTHKKHSAGERITRYYILDRRGSLITEIDGSDNKPGDLMTHFAITRAALIGKEWPVESSYIGVNNQPVFGTKTSIPLLSWTLVSEVIASKITQSIWQSLYKTILFTLLGMIVFVWFVLYLAGKTLKPIQNACEAIDHVAKGNYQYILPICGIHELDVMTAGFNNMVKARQRAENLLQQREQDLAITLNSIGDAVITTDDKGCVTRMNPVAEQLVGWSLQQAHGKPVKTIFPIIDAATRESIENPVDKVIATGETVSLSNHTTLISRDGTEYQIADSAAPIRNGDDSILGMVLIFNDVTEQYKLRQAAIRNKKNLQNIMDSMPAAVYVRDSTGRFLFINQQFEKLSHIIREDIIGKTLHEIFPQNIASEMRRSDKAVLETGHVLESEEVAAQNGGLHTYVTLKFPLFYDTDNVYAVCGISTDITQRKKMENEIRSSAQHLKLYREQAPLGVIEWDVDFRINDWNAAAGKMFGYALDEVKGRYFSDFMLPESAIVDVKNIWSDLIGQTGGTKSINENITKDGRIILCEWHNTPLRDEAGKVIGAASIVQDITERQQAAESMKRLNRSLRALSACNEVLVRAADENELLNTVCGIIVDIAGYRLAWVGLVEHDKAKTIRSVAQAGYEEGYLDTVKLTWADTERGQGPGGTVVRTGKPCIIRDIHSDSRFALWRHQAIERGYASVVGLPLVEGRRTFGVLLIYASEVNSFDDEELRLLNELVEDLAYGIMTLRSHKERHQLNRQLQQAQKMEAIGQLTGGIAHDFNNILASILGFTSLALQRFVRDDQAELREYLNEVTQAGERARDLVSQLLAFSRTSSNNASLLQIPPVIKEVTKLLQATLPSSIELSGQIDADVPAVMMDMVQLQQVLMNMCINARDAIGDKGHIEIRVRRVYSNSDHSNGPNDILLRHICDACHNEIEAADYIELSVQDTGSGISDDKLNQIFEPFFTTKEVGKGTGMGLSMVHGIIHQHGGHILVDTQSGVGTTFRLLLPVAEDVPNHKPDIKLETSIITEGLNNARILIVDDEESVARFIGDLLESRDGRVTVMTNSQAALDLFNQNPTEFDLIITDQTMPGLTGVELAQEILALRPEQPVMLCTGYSEHVDEEKAKALGIRGYLNKPMEVNTLLNMVQTLIH